MPTYSFLRTHADNLLLLPEDISHCSRKNVWPTECIGVNLILMLLKNHAQVNAKDRYIYQGTNVVKYSSTKLNQGTIRKKGCHLFPGPFFSYFLGEAKK
jgi:hypothetical protein